MESLNKQQIILLAILVSFVTSIATGIMTASLLEEANPVVTQTVNRIVERTVERVVPQVTEEKPGKTVVERETIVVKEDELVPTSVESNVPALARIFEMNGEEEEDVFLGVGVIVRKDGTILAPQFSITSFGSYYARLADGSLRTIATASTTATSTPLSLLAIVPGQDGPATFPATTLGRSAALRLGQTVISLSGSAKAAVDIGIITAMETASGTPVSVSTDLDRSMLVDGSPLINLNGQVVGLYDHSEDTFIPVDLVRGAFGI